MKLGGGEGREAFDAIFVCSYLSASPSYYAGVIPLLNFNLKKVPLLNFNLKKVPLLNFNFKKMSLYLISI